MSAQLAILENKVNELGAEIERLRCHRNLLMGLVDASKAPFNFLMLESNANQSQINAILDLMQSIRTAISQGNPPMSHGQFEREIYKIFPTKHGSYQLAELIVKTLNDEGKYEEVYQHMKKDGMNIWTAMKTTRYALEIYRGDKMIHSFESSTPFLPIGVGDTLTVMPHAEQMGKVKRVHHWIGDYEDGILHKIGVYFDRE